MMNLLDAAIYIATDAHRGELNKHDGELYIHHPQRVAINLREAGFSEKYQAVAWLHDVVEDTDWTLEMIAAFLRANIDVNVPDLVLIEVINAINAMTHRKGDTNEDYYRGIKRDAIARAVGFFDKTVENFGRNHQIVDDEEKQLRLAKKYSLATSILDGPGPVA